MKKRLRQQEKGGAATINIIREGGTTYYECSVFEDYIPEPVCLVRQAKAQECQICELYKKEGYEMV